MRKIYSFGYSTAYIIIILTLFSPLNIFGQTKFEIERQQREEEFRKNIQADYCHTESLPENRAENNIIERLNRLTNPNRSGSRSSQGTWDLINGYGASCDVDCDLTTASRNAVSCSGSQSSSFQIPIVYTLSTATGCFWDHDNDASTPDVAITSSIPTQAELQAMVDIMTDFFACQGIDMSFYLCGNDPSAPNGIRTGDFGCVYDETTIADIPNVVNIYVYPNTGNGAGCNGFAPLPFSTSSDMDVAMSHACYENFMYTPGSMDCSDPELGLGFVLIHEFGHYFGLFHTHDTSTPSGGICDDPNTAADDCTSGDRIQDTDEDPDFSGGEIGCTGCDTGGPRSNCTFNNTLPNCAPYGTPNTIDNIMSYNSFAGCTNKFSTCQKAKMMDALTCVRGLQMCCRDVTEEFAGGLSDTQKEICVGDATAPTFTASSTCYRWYDGLGSTANNLATGVAFTPTIGTGAGQLDNTTPGDYTWYLGDLNELNPDCRTPVTVTVYPKAGTAFSSGSNTPLNLSCGSNSISLTPDGANLGHNDNMIGWYFSDSNPTSITTSAAISTAISGATNSASLNHSTGNVIQSTSGDPLIDLMQTVDCAALNAAGGDGTYFMTPFIAFGDAPVTCSTQGSSTSIVWNFGGSGMHGGATTSNIGPLSSSCAPGSLTLDSYSVVINVTSYSGSNTSGLIRFDLRDPSTESCSGVGTAGSVNLFCSSAPCSVTLTAAQLDAAMGDGNFDILNDAICISAVDFPSDATTSISYTVTITANYSGDDAQTTWNSGSSPDIGFTSGQSNESCFWGTPIQINCDCSSCPTLTTPTALSIGSQSSCGTACAPTGGSWALAASPCLSGSSLQSFTSPTITTGGIAMTTAPTYNPTTAETFYVRCVCDSDATMVSAVQTVTSTPGSCTNPATPTLTINNNSCPSTTGTIAATGAGGTFSYFTGANLTTVMTNAMSNTGGSTTAPSYLATAINVCVVETDGNGCRSAPSCGVTVPVNCTVPCPTLTTPTALSIGSQSSCGTGCASTGGAWALAASPCISGASLQSFTSATITTGGTAMTTAPTYDPITAETYYVRCVCDSDATMVSAVQTVTSTPGSCTNPATPSLMINNNSCPTTTGTIAAIGAGGTLAYFTGADAATAMSNATSNTGGSLTVPSYSAFPTVVNVCVVETDANGCRSAPSCGVTVPQDCPINVVSNYGLNFGDPCSCTDPLNCTDGSNNLLFHDVMTVTTSPATSGLNIRVQSSTDFFIDVPCNGGVLTTPTSGVTQILPKPGSPGVYELVFWRPEGAIPTLTVTENGGAPISVPNITFQPACSCPDQTIPTMSEWGLIIFCLLILNLGVVLVYRRKTLEDLLNGV